MANQSQAAAPAGRAEVPKQLRNPDLRFVKIRRGEKRPFETEWQKTRNYAWDDADFQVWLSQDNNYGVLCGVGGLLVIDADTPELAEALKRLPQTFAVKTGSGGMHAYYFCADFEKKIIFQAGEKHFGEAQFIGQQVVGPGSLHPNGNRYTVVCDLPVASVSRKEILENLSDFMDTEKTVPREKIAEYRKEKDDFNSQIKIPAIFSTAGMKTTREGYQGAHPFHGSETGANFCVNTSENVWHCFRHNCGGGGLQMLAMKEGLIDCGEKLRGGDFKKAVQIAVEKYGLKIDGIKNAARPESEADLDIWNYNSKGERTKLNLKNVVENVMRKEHFLTIGDDKYQTLFYEGGIYKEGGEKKIAVICENMAEGVITNHHVQEVVAQVRRRTFVERDVLFPENAELICMKNGLLNIETCELMPHSPKIIFTQRINIDYTRIKKCPKILAFLESIIDTADMDCVQEFIGYLLYRKYSFKKAVILVGERDTGKTTFIKLLITFIGQKNTSGVSLHDLAENRFAAAQMEHKLLNSYDDLSFDDIDDTSAFKIATGGGFCSGEKKFGEIFQFMNYAKQIFATNKIAGVKNMDDEAYYGRWLLFYFKNVFITEKNADEERGIEAKPNIIGEITTEEELSGFFNWALAGLQRLIKNGKFSYNRTAEQNKNLMLMTNDSIYAFNEVCLAIEESKWLSKEDTYNFYLIFCRLKSLAPVTKVKFGIDLPIKTEFREGRQDCDGKKSVNGWQNIGFKVPKEMKVDTPISDGTKYTDFTEFFKHIYTNYKMQNIPKNKEKIPFLLDYMYIKKSVKSLFGEES